MPAGEDPHLADTRPAEQGGPRPSRTFAPGEMVSPRYRMVGQIGAGSTGVVYRANDLAFDREVAVKVMSQSHGEATALFLREARTTARLDHPSIVPIHDLVWLTGGGIAFAMKHIDGISLREALRLAGEGRPPRCLATVNDTINVFLKVCDGIALAHARGVIHCDIKPDNILIGQFGEVIILDWGEASSGDGGKDTDAPVGTPAYMSPEQARGEPATPASDIHCIGASLFHCLLGRPPLAGKDLEPAEFWERKRRGVVDRPTAAEAARVDRHLLAILDKALDPRPDARYPSVRALADDLAAFQGGQAVSAYRDSWLERAMRWHRRHARTLWLTLLLVSSVLVLVGVLWGGHLQRMANWGRPVFREDFSEDWHERWRIASPGSHAIGEGRAVSQQDGESTMVLRREWPPRSSLEFTGESLPGVVEGDISVYWLEGPEAVDGHWGGCRSGWGFLFGAWDNTCSALEQVRRGVIACDRSSVVVPGRKHRIRAEVDGDRRRLIVDGRTVFDHQDSFSAGSGRWMIYTWGPGKVITDVSVQLRGASAVVPATGIPDALRGRGLAREAAAEYRIIAESKAGSELADQAYFKEGITWSEIGEWDRAAAAWGCLREPLLVEEASLLALQPLIDSDPHRLLGEIAARWPRASSKGRTTMIDLWSSVARIFSSTHRMFDGELIDTYFDLRSRLFPEALQADPASAQAARRTGRLRRGAEQILNPCLRAETVIKLGDVQRVEAEGTPGVRASMRRLLSAGPAVVRSPVAVPLPEWLRQAGSGAFPQVRSQLFDGGDMEAVTILDRIFGDPRQSQENGPIGQTLANCLWQHALQIGDAKEAVRWERVNRQRDADRTMPTTWVQGLLEPTLFLAVAGRRDEARRLAEVMRAEPRTSWNGAAAAWGAALCGEEVAVLPDLVHASPLLAAMRAELAGEAAAGLWRIWFDLALPSHSITSTSLLRLAWWRSQPVQR